MSAPARMANEDDVIGTAADWLITLTSGDATEADARALAEWREADPAHEAAFRHVARLMNLTRELIDHPPRPVASRRAVLAGGIGAVLTGGTIGLSRPPLGLWPSWAELMADHRTGAGERFDFSPVAGVAIEMNSRTSMSLAGGGRTVDLVTGEAFVTVARGAAPFTVRAGGIGAETRAATFNVQAIDGDIAVVCVDGTVECRHGTARQRLGPNETLALADDGTTTRGTAKAGTATAWRDGLLVFEDTPLSEVVRQINRYRTGDIVLTNGAIGGRPVNAVLHTAQIDNAVSQIQQLLGLQARRLPGGVILMS